MMENIKLLDHNQCGGGGGGGGATTTADVNGTDKKKRRVKSCHRKWKHILDKLEKRKLFVEMMLCESMEDLSIKLFKILKCVYKDSLLEASIYFIDPLIGDFVCYKNGDGTSSSRKNSYDVIQKWCSKNNNSKNNSSAHADIRSYDFADQFRSVFPLSPDLNFSAGSHSTTSFSPCCKLRKADSLRVVSWPLFDDSSDEAFGLIFLLVKSSSQYLQPVLDGISPHVIKTHQKIMSQIENHQKYLILNDLGTLFTKDIAELSRRITNKLTKTLQAESGVVLLVNRNSEELSVEAFGDTLLEDEFKFDMSGEGLSTLFKQPKVCSLTIDKDSPIAVDLQRLKEYAGKDIDIHHMLVVPAYSGTSKEEVAAIFCLFNKKASKTGFTTLDEELMSMVVENCRHIVCNALDWKQQKIIQRQNESLLDISKTLFRHLDDVSILLHKIMEEARNLIKAERCSLFLVDHAREELVAEVFDGCEGVDAEKTELRLNINQGIAGHVATTGETLNIRDAYSHPLFYSHMDERTGFRTKHILCFPILSVSACEAKYEERKQVIGVGQLCNKINGSCFTKFDEERTTSFAIFVGLSLVQSLLYKKATIAQQRSKLANELMLYHMRVSSHDIEKYTDHPLPVKADLDERMDSFNFIPRIQFKELDSVKIVLAMFTDLDILRRFKIQERTVVRFILTVRRAYRNVPYHNWVHAWTVAHFSYTLLKQTNAREYLSDLEVFVLLVACLCHDVDHRGTSNSFQLISQSLLASLYSSAGSVLEQHHFAQTMCVLNSEDCNIFESLTEQEYRESLDLLHNLILATDLANHFKLDKEIDVMITNSVNKDNTRHVFMLMSLMMTTSDLSDQTKPWESARIVADLLYAEFFAQGDSEKKMGCKPAKDMDREQARIPDLQVGFLRTVIEPIYRKLSLLFPQVKVVMKNIHDNMDNWQTMASQNTTIASQNTTMSSQNT